MTDLDATLAGNRAAVTDLLTAAEAARSRWTVPRAPGKWSPAQVVEHVARSLEEAANEVTGAPSLFPRFPALFRPLLRTFFFRRVLRTGSFPKAKTNRAMDPATGPTTVAEARIRVEGAMGRFGAACSERAAARREVESGIFGTVPVTDYARFQEIHTRHHTDQIPAP